MKIMDFGLSRILGTMEKSVEGLVNGAIYAVEQLKKEKKQYHTNNY